MVAIVAVGMALVAGCAGTPAGAGNSMGAQALQDPSPFEKRVLADKHVTRAELDESVRVYTECLTAAGIEYEVQPGVGISSILLHGSLSPGSDSAAELEEFDEKMEGCIDEVSAVGNVWTLQNHVSVSELETMRNTFVSCLRDAGLPLAEGATYSDAREAASQLRKSMSGPMYDDSTEQGRTLIKVTTCQQDFQGVSGAQPLPGLAEALEALDTSGW